jgi:hypothetical protein
MKRKFCDEPEKIACSTALMDSMDAVQDSVPVHVSRTTMFVEGLRDHSSGGGRATTRVAPTKNVSGTVPSRRKNTVWNNEICIQTRDFMLE